MSEPSTALGRRAVLVGGGSILMLSACSNIIGPPAASPLYVLDPANLPAPTGSQLDWQMTVNLPESSDSLDTTRIMLLQPTGQIDYYADAEWQDRLPFVIQGTLIEAFEASGRLPGVGRDSEGLKSEYVLITDIREFQARYSAPDAAPMADVHLVIKLLAARTRSIVMTTDAKSQIQAGQNNVASVVAAFNQALSAAQAQIVEAVLKAPTPARF